MFCLSNTIFWILPPFSQKIHASKEVNTTDINNIHSIDNCLGRYTAIFARSWDNQVYQRNPVLHHWAILHFALFLSLTGSFFSSIHLVTINHIPYATAAAIAYPITDFNNIFSSMNVLANALNTRKVVDTGIPTLVNSNKAAGATAWYHCISWYGILFNLPYDMSPPFDAQPYHKVKRRTDDAAPQR